MTTAGHLPEKPHTILWFEAIRETLNTSDVKQAVSRHLKITLQVFMPSRVEYAHSIGKNYLLAQVPVDPVIETLFMMVCTISVPLTRARNRFTTCLVGFKGWSSCRQHSNIAERWLNASLQPILLQLSNKYDNY